MFYIRFFVSPSKTWAKKLKAKSLSDLWMLIKLGSIMDIFTVAFIETQGKRGLRKKYA